MLPTFGMMRAWIKQNPDKTIGAVIAIVAITIAAWPDPPPGPSDRYQPPPVRYTVEECAVLALQATAGDGDAWAAVQYELHC